MNNSEAVNWRSRGIYVHVPFCLRKCLYCDFVSYPLEQKEVNLYLKALCREIDLYGSFNEKYFSSLYIGGGTPTCLTAQQLKEIIKKVFNTFCFHQNAEVTIEANPGTIDVDKLTVLLDLGCNRLSIGVQSLDNKILRVLGRLHSAEQAVQAVKNARTAGFKNINIDLIYGVPGQSLKKWRETLKSAIELETEHISAYCLQLEPGTALFESIKSGLLKECPEELELEMYFETIKMLEDHGYIHYEISNFAKAGQESRHNLIYWNNGFYLGFGPAAHSCWKGYRTGNETDIKLYAGKTCSGRKPLMTEEKVDEKSAMSETMFLGLRKIEGVKMSDFAERFGDSIENVYGSRISHLENLGLLKKENGFIRLTRRALPVSNEVFMEFV